MRVACAQYAVRDGNPDHNLERSLQFIRQAAAERADLVVLPELANSGCTLGSRPWALDLAEEVPDGPTVEAWRKEAEETSVYVAGGLLERDGDTLHNSAVMLGPGAFGRYRKTHLWDREKLLYEPGQELPVFNTPLGRIGLLVCYDAWFSEAARTLAVNGAQILCVPSNAPNDWVPEHQRRGDLTMLNVHCIAAANANRVFVATANRVGDGYLGRSCIVDATGGILALAGASEEGLVTAEMDLNRAQREKRLTNLSHSFEDRNPTVYDGRSQQNR
jgi:N-carbamoylputrescine amidase